MQLVSTLAVLAAAVASVRAQGNAYVYNHCSQQVYLWAVDTERNPSSPTVIPPGGSWSEPYHTPANGGVSIKLSKSPSNTAITQFEYTLTGGQWNQIWYDGSNINCVDAGCPFQGENLYLGASVSSCPQVYCGSGDSICNGFYNTPDENLATKACAPTSDTFMHLCLPDEKMPGGSNIKAVAHAAPAPSAPAPAPTTTKPAAIIMEAPVATTLHKRVAPTAASIAERAPEPQALAAHAHARRHLHHRV